MGTNYYVEDGKKCSKCGAGGEEIHIGKSSAGWEFTFAWNNGEYYKSLPELKKWLRGRQIVDVMDVNFLPQEHARSIFRGVQDLGLEYMPTMQAVDALASHMGKVSLRSSMPVQAQRIAMHLEENLISQRPYLIEGMVA